MDQEPQEWLAQQDVPSAPPAPYQHPQVVIPRQPILFVLASVFFPGLGSGMANGKWAKGALFFFSQIIAIPLILLFGLGILLLFGIRIWACIDAYHETQDWNHQHGFIT